MHEALIFDSAVSELGDISERLRSLPGSIRSRAYEIRIRCGLGISLSMPGGEIYEVPDSDVSPTAMREIFRSVCGYAVYSHQEDIARGFITVAGGHRVGICGTAVTQGDNVTAVRDISSLNIRIAREIPGCADRCMEALFADGICGALIAGAPCSGKTTILRDIAFALSSGRNAPKRKVTIIDERGEIAAMSDSRPSMSIGCCDVLDGYPKAWGMLHAVRCLSPDIIICDEIGTPEECRAIAACVNAGVSVIASVHAGNADELRRREQIRILMRTGAFARAAMISAIPHPGTLTGIVKAGDIV